MRYYVNKIAQPNGDHEVHQSTCTFLPSEDNRVYLGDYTACAPAVEEAKRRYSQSNGCYHCSYYCHTT